MGDSIAIFNLAGEVILLLNKLSLPYDHAKEIQLRLFKRAIERPSSGRIEEICCEVYRGHVCKNGDSVILVMSSVFVNPYEGKILLNKVMDFCKNNASRGGEVRSEIVMRKNVELLGSLEDMLYGMEPRLNRRDFFALSSNIEELHLMDKTAWIVQASKPWVEGDIYTSAKARAFYDLQSQNTLLTLNISLPDSYKQVASEPSKYPFASSLASSNTAHNSFTFLRKSTEATKPQRPSFTGVEEEIRYTLTSQDSFQPVSNSLLKMCRIVIMVCDK